MSDNFNYAIPFILLHEIGPGGGTGLVDDPADAGGLTKWGICQRSYPHLDIRALTRDDAIAIYQRDFWQSSWDQLDKRVAAKCMDVSVNCGMAWGPRILQTALGVGVDGIIGPCTIAAANREDTKTLLAGMVKALNIHYDKILEAHPEYHKFEAGWDHRSAWIPPDKADNGHTA